MQDYEIVSLVHIGKDAFEILKKVPYLAVRMEGETIEIAHTQAPSITYVKNGDEVIFNERFIRLLKNTEDAYPIRLLNNTEDTYPVKHPSGVTCVSRVFDKFRKEFVWLGQFSNSEEFVDLMVYHGFEVNWDKGSFSLYSGYCSVKVNDGDLYAIYSDDVVLTFPKDVTRFER